MANDYCARSINTVCADVAHLVEKSSFNKIKEQPIVASGRVKMKPAFERRWKQSYCFVPVSIEGLQDGATERSQNLLFCCYF